MKQEKNKNDNWRPPRASLGRDIYVARDNSSPLICSIFVSHLFLCTRYKDIYNWKPYTVWNDNKIIIQAGPLLFRNVSCAAGSAPTVVCVEDTR